MEGGLANPSDSVYDQDCNFSVRIHTHGWKLPPNLIFYVKPKFVYTPHFSGNPIIVLYFTFSLLKTLNKMYQFC